jgi:hypothetical protein
MQLAGPSFGNDNMYLTGATTFATNAWGTYSAVYDGTANSGGIQTDTNRATVSGLLPSSLVTLNTTGFNDQASTTAASLNGISPGPVNGTGISYELCEILIYSGPVTAADQTQVIKYLQAKWNLN